METEVLVYVELAGTPHLAGRLWARVRRATESASFEYDPGWLAYAERFSLEPALDIMTSVQRPTSVLIDAG